MKFTAATPARRSFGFGLVSLVGGRGMAWNRESLRERIDRGPSRPIRQGGTVNRANGVRSPGDGWNLFVTMSLETMGLNKPCRFLESIGEKVHGQSPAMADRAMV